MMFSTKWLSLTFTLILSFAFDFGCRVPDKKEEQVSKEKTTPPPSAKMEEVRENPSELEYIYTPVGKRNPFKSYFFNINGKKGEPCFRKILLDYEMDQLKLIAIVTGISEPTAMVEIPSGEGILIRRGSPIGKHGGKVSVIKRDRIIITEEYRDLEGRIRKTEIEGTRFLATYGDLSR